MSARALLASTLATGLVVSACSGTGAERDPLPNLLLIVVDTLRRDHLGCYGYERPTSPAIDAFAAEAVRFERAYSAAPWTQPAVASILTGLHPSAHSVTRMRRGLPEALETLPERLAAAGYRTGAVVSHHLLDRSYHFDQGFAFYDDSLIGGDTMISSAGVTDAGLRFLAEAAGDDRPFFLLLHYFDPHYAYREWDPAGFVPDERRRDGPPPALNELRRDLDAIDADALRYLVDAYDEEIRRVDAGLERLLAGLAERGLDADTWVVLTADHGEEFLERGWLGHTVHLHDETLAVPLLVRPPGGTRARTVATPVSTTGLTATLLDLLEQGYPPEEFQVPSFAAAVRGEEAAPAPPVFAEVDFLPYKVGDARKRVRRQALVACPWKLIVDDLNGTRELYHLGSDPAERNDRAAQEPVRAVELAERLAAFAREAREREVASRERRLSPAEVKALLELGYIEDL